jgi:hypothetical protein
MDVIGVIVEGETDPEFPDIIPSILLALRLSKSSAHANQPEF